MMAMVLILMEFQKLKHPLHVMYSIEQGPFYFYLHPKVTWEEPGGSAGAELGTLGSPNLQSRFLLDGVAPCCFARPASSPSYPLAAGLANGRISLQMQTAAKPSECVCVSGHHRDVARATSLFVKIVLLRPRYLEKPCLD